jgi:hypothetical protein
MIAAERRGGTMKAIVQEGYGSPDALNLREVEMRGHRRIRRNEKIGTGEV